MEAIEYNVLKQLVLEVLKKDNGNLQYLTIQSVVTRLIFERKLFPSREECKQRGIAHSYGLDRLNPSDDLNINQIIWDLIIDRVLTLGNNISNPDWPFLRLTEYGKKVVNQELPSWYDPEGYSTTLDSIVPNVDPVIKQYSIEGLNCYKQRLFFASAVMFGAAAEKSILILAESIYNSESNSEKKKNIKQLLEYTNLPKIFLLIQSTIDELIKNKVIPYSTHQGSTEHLLSLFNSIRVQRNDAVHPIVGQINKIKILLVIQTFPFALSTVYRLTTWFNNNKI